MSGGPFWVVANTFNGYLIMPIRKGTNDVAEADYGAGWTLVYHNTMHSEYVLESGESYPTPWFTNHSQGRGRYVNNIFSGYGPNYMSGPTSAAYVWPETDPDVLFSHNAWYLIAPDAEPFVWDQDGHATEAEMAAAAPDAQLQVTGNVYGINPFPDGIGGAVDSRIRNIGRHIPGVSNFMQDANGVNIGGETPQIGSFPRFRKI